MKKRLLILLLLVVFPVFLAGKTQKPDIKVGILSDVHVREHKADSIFIKALEYFKGCDVDAVMLVGDFTTDGTEDQLENIAKDWFMVFPDDKGRRGKKVERIFVYGNHEMEGTTYKEAITRYSQEYLDAHRIADHKAEYWEKYWHEPFDSLYMKEVNGYVFLAAHYNGKAETPGMKEFFDKVGPALPKDKPVFYIQHKHPKWTIPWATDNGNSSRILRDYPNLICFSGHCHNSLTDEKSIWQGKFTSVNTASLKRLGTRSGHENTKVSKNKEGYVPQMPMHYCWDGHQGMLMEVFPDRVVLHRYDFHFDEFLGDWVIPNDVSQRPYDPKARAALGAANPPQFEDGDSPRVVKAFGKNRKKERVDQVRVYFPVAISNGERSRALDYKVDVERQDADSVAVVASKLVYSPFFHHSEARDRQKGAKCVFAVSELPAGVKLRFAVYPQDSFGNSGNAIYSKNFEL